MVSVAYRQMTDGPGPPARTTNKSALRALAASLRRPWACASASSLPDNRATRLTIGRPGIHRVRRFSRASPRRYARSTASPTRCASAASAISRGKPVSSPTQSRKAERKPWTVTACFARRRTISRAMTDKPLPDFWPGKTYWFPSTPSAAISAMIASARSLSGTRCSRAAFIRAAGTVQTLAIVSISGQKAPSVSPERAAVNIVNSRARAATPDVVRKWATKAATSAYTIALWWPRVSCWRFGNNKSR